MEQIRNKEYGGERPLFATHDLQLEDVTILSLIHIWTLPTIA